MHFTVVVPTGNRVVPLDTVTSFSMPSSGVRSAKQVGVMEISPVASVAVTSHVTVLLSVPGATATGSMLPGQEMTGLQVSNRDKEERKREREREREIR